MTDTKRQITPHKGGRTERAHVRLTPDEKARLDATLKRTGLSLADFIMLCVDERTAKKESND